MTNNPSWPLNVIRFEEEVLQATFSRYNIPPLHRKIWQENEIGENVGDCYYSRCLSDQPIILQTPLEDYFSN